MLAENLHTRFCVRVLGGFEPKSGNAQFGKEFIDDSNQVVQTQILVYNKPFNLVKFSQMCSIQSFIPEHPVNWLKLPALELLCLVHKTLLCNLVQHLRTECSGVCPQHIRPCLLLTPVLLLPDTPGSPSILVCLFHSLHLPRVYLVASQRVFHEECVMRIACGVLLRLEEWVEVPETALHPLVGRHLLEPHFE